VGGVVGWWGGGGGGGFVGGGVGGGGGGGVKLSPRSKKVRRAVQNFTPRIPDGNLGLEKLHQTISCLSQCWGQESVRVG